MKNIKYLYFFWIAVFITACTEEKELLPIDNDAIAPGPPQIESIENGSGVATIKYKLPNDADLLYLKASYVVNDKQMEVKSSYYNNSVTLEGFNEIKSYEIKLTCIDRSNNEGEAVIATVHPEEAPIFKIFKTLKISTDWGGAKFTWENKFNAPVIINLLVQDSTGKFNPLEWVYTEASEGVKSLRGFEPEERTFAAVIRDRYDNYSDTLFRSTIPLFEEEIVFDQSNLMVLDNDTHRNSWSGAWGNLFDSDIRSYVAFETAYPQIFSFDLDARAKLSRFILYSRVTDPSHYYGLGNPQKFRLYGAAELPTSNDLSDWELLGTYDIKKPSGLPFSAELTTEDKAYVDNGFECEISIEMPEVRYIRIAIDKTFANTLYSYLGDLKFYGQVKE